MHFHLVQKKAAQGYETEYRRHGLLDLLAMVH